MRLDPARCALDESVNQNWTVTVEEHTTIDDVLRSDFFANVANKMRPYDRIRVRVDTGEWYAELLVLTCGRAWLKTVTIYHIDLTSKDIDQTQAERDDDYFVQYRGPHLKFCVTRKSDRTSIKENLETKGAAIEWMASFLKTI